MRLWTIHPKYLDSRGLVALWREGLLAQKVLRGKTKGYRHHPQLERFRSHPKPVGMIARYLAAVYDESLARGYKFDKSRIGRSVAGRRLLATEGQLFYEWSHLLQKLRKRDYQRFRQIEGLTVPDPHPLFRIVKGGVSPWERIGE